MFLKKIIDQVHQSVDSLICNCIKRANSDLRVYKGDIITTLNAP